MRVPVISRAGSPLRLVHIFVGAALRDGSDYFVGATLRGHDEEMGGSRTSGSRNGGSRNGGSRNGGSRNGGSCNGGSRTAPTC